MLPQRPSRARSFFKLISGLIFLTIVGGASWWVVQNRQFILDQTVVWLYQPTSDVIALVDRAGMNEKGKFYFLASQPVLDGTQNFNLACDRVESVTSILGCFNDYRIYIYDVTDRQLDGIREVTAAHETLHAIYVRMNDEEKNTVDTLLEAEYKKLEKNSDYKDLMAFYDRAEPGQRDNELHSIIGTEIKDISSNLETYYSKYFSDRQKAVALNTKYNSVFKKLDTRAKKIAKQLNELAASINSRVSKYNSSVQTLNSDILAFNKLAESGELTNEQFNSQKSALLARIATLESLRSSIRNDIAKHQSLLDEYNSIASESNKLTDSLDSTLAPAPSV